MSDIEKIFSDSARHLVANAPEGVDAWLLSKFQDPGPWPQIFVCRDDARVARLSATLGFFRPELEVVTLPAWDCLPYDRVSPHRDILAQRVAALTRLIELDAADASPPFLLVTTVNALIQRLPPRAAFRGRVLARAAGEALSPDALTAFLTANGYLRSDSVSEPGEYAVRGGLVDVFPPTAAQPLRLDFFGDELETIRLPRRGQHNPPRLCDDHRTRFGAVQITRSDGRLRGIGPRHRSSRDCAPVPRRPHAVRINGKSWSPTPRPCRGCRLRRTSSRCAAKARSV